MKRDEELSSELYEVVRRKGTEAPFSGKYWGSREKGMYKCTICGAELFSSKGGKRYCINSVCLELDKKLNA